MKNAPRCLCPLVSKCGFPFDRFGGAGFLELERGYQPWVIPKSEARGGAGHAVKKVKRWLRKMDEQMDYEFYDWNLRSYRFKSPFDRRPLVGPRERCRKNAAKRTLRLVGLTDPDYLLQCEDAAFGDWEDSCEDEDEVFEW
uniref:OSJNBa0079A21.10 protein n=4 Tax=Oryza TaxID=4527 RepID=Q7XSD4_ORYSJ|nr:OSJNBa0079A21.10 [Oryza sativa Japonica Group]